MVINNSNLLTLCNNCGAVGFVPVLEYEYDAAAKTVTITDGSTFPAGSELTRIKVKVHDFFGAEARGNITVAGGDVEIDISALNTSKPLSITATITTVDHIAADGSASGYLATEGILAFYDVQKNA